MVNIMTLEKTNAERWNKVQLIKKSSFLSVANRLTAPSAKHRYQIVSQKTGVPWFVIAVIHERECSQSWSDSLAQGDPWNRVSVHVPRGRGPFTSWEAAAEDALVNCAPYAARHKDWNIGPMLTLLEEYNGLGYASRDLPSPYIWAGTNQYKSGKYIADGRFDPNVVDQQLGCAGLIIAMMQLDKSIQLEHGLIVPAPTPVPVPQPQLQPQSFWGWLVSLFTSILQMFQKK